jgi:hypothetical protein
MYSGVGQYLPEGAKVPQAGFFDSGTGVRSIRMGFDASNAEAGNALQAELREWVSDWGIRRGLLDKSGNPVPGAGKMPVAEDHPFLSAENFEGGGQKILNPRFAAEMRRLVIQAGGTFDLDKDSGITEWLVPEGAVTGEGKSLVKSLRSRLAASNRGWKNGNASLSSLADGASPATVEERAHAQIARQARIKDAKQAAVRNYIQANHDSQLAIEEAIKTQKITSREEKAALAAAERTPGTPEFQARIFRELKAQGTREDTIEKFIEQNPNSRLAVRKRQQIWARRGQKAKRLGGGAIHAARSAVTMAIGTILTLITTGVAFLAKSYQVITQIGGDIRKRTLNEAKFNFAPDTVRGFELFAAEHGGMDKDLLVRAAGGIQAAWSTPLNYADSGFNQLAPYLRENTVHLVQMAAAGGDANVLNIMSNIVDDLVSQSLRGVSGAKTFNPNSAEGRHRAFSGNFAALSSHNEAWGELMNLYWHDFLSSGASSIAVWTEADRNGQMRSMSFENWVTQADWSKLYQKETGISSPVIRDAAEETYGLVSNFVGTFSNLATDIATGLSGYFGQIAENLRNIINNWLSPYFPAFVMKENQRAEYLNTQSQMLATRLTFGYEAEAKRALLDIGYDYDLPQFREIIDAIGRGDTSAIPYHIDLAALRDNMSAFTRYYHVQDILENIETERTKAAENKNYVQKYIVGTSSSIATVAGERALILQNRLDRGVSNTPVRPPDADTQHTATDFGTQVVVGVLNAPNAVKRAADMVASASYSETVGLEDRIKLTRRDIEKRTNPDGSFTWFGYGIRNLYDQEERDLRALIIAYDKDGDTDSATDAMRRLQVFYENYPQKLIKHGLDQQQAINEKIDLDTSWLWMGEKFAEASKTQHPAVLAARVGGLIRQREAQGAYAEEYTDLLSRAAAQQRTTNETTAAGLYNKIEERLGAEADLSRNPDLESMYRWLAANRANSIYLDAFDERNNRAMSDIIINFNTDGAVKQTVRLPNTYGLRTDVSLRRRDSIMPDLTAALEAASAP